MIAYLRYAAKAVFAGTTTALGSVAVLLIGDTTLSAVTQGQWVTILLATVVAVGGVFGLSNAPNPRDPE